MVKSIKYREACIENIKEVLTVKSYASDKVPSSANDLKHFPPSFSRCLVVDSQNCTSDDAEKLIKLRISPTEIILGICSLETFGTGSSKPTNKRGFHIVPWWFIELSYM
ncbi:hypothetical protein TNCV_1411511 [Trichonephila clavipes]|nr:hypothetical protein TNCV_1411511 [Trichonephila clavipes]